MPKTMMALASTKMVKESLSGPDLVKRIVKPTSSSGVAMTAARRCNAVLFRATSAASIDRGYRRVTAENGTY